MEALFKAAQLEAEVTTLKFSLSQAEAKLYSAENAHDQAVGAFHQLNLLYTVAQVALQKAVSGSDCISEQDREIQARASWNGPEAVTVPKMAIVDLQSIEQSAVVLKGQLDQGQAEQAAAMPYARAEPFPHPKTIPMPPRSPEPKPDKSGQGNG